MVNVKNFDPSLLETNKLSFKGIFSVNIYYINKSTMKSFDHVNIDNENFLFVVCNNVEGYMKERNGIKYLVLFFQMKTKKSLKQHTKYWNETKNQIETTSSGEPVK